VPNKGRLNGLGLFTCHVLDHRHVALEIARSGGNFRGKSTGGYETEGGKMGVRMRSGKRRLGESTNKGWGIVLFFYMLRRDEKEIGGLQEFC